MPSDSATTAAIPSAPQTPRILSIDIFRGLTMLVMIFVNDLAFVKGLPWWTYHIPGGVNGMTYVDVVFPAFLFIVGMSIPPAVRRRTALGDSPVKLWSHILIRSLGLVVLGIILANSGKLDPERAGISRELWGALAFLGAILFWSIYPRNSRHRTAWRVLKVTGLFLIVGVLAVFRRTQAGHSAWLDFSYWEILGLIGTAYLSACILYVPFHRRRWAPLLFLIVLCTLNIMTAAGGLKFLRHLPRIIWPFGNGALASIVMAGILASQIFLEDSLVKTMRHRVLLALGYAAALGASGTLLIPLGTSKIRATPTWCLYTSAISILIFLALYWIADIKHLSRWAFFVQPAGANTLLTYLLPDIFYALLGSYWFAAQASQPWHGVLRSALFTAFILLWAAGMTKIRVRLQL